MNSDKTNLKKIAAEKAVEQIKSGMVIGLGVGSTAIHAVNKIGSLIESGELKDISAIACSKATHDHAQKLGIPLTSFSEDRLIDITIDGADEVDANLNLIKGGGGALLREKIVAQSTLYEIIVVDDSKISKYLGEKFYLPIEILKFGWETHMKFLESLGGEPTLRKDDSGHLYETDQSNFIIDCNFGPIKNPESLAKELESRAGIIEHGLFLGLAKEVIVASSSGIKTIKK